MEWKLRDRITLIPGTQQGQHTQVMTVLFFPCTVYFKKLMDWAQEYNGIYRILLGPRALVVIYTPESVKVCIFIHVNNCFLWYIVCCIHQDICSIF